MSQLLIREAVTSDVPAILKFITDLAIYERAEDEMVATEMDLTETLFGQHAQAHALMCEIEGQLAGFAVYFFNYSTWLGRHGLYLEDLYVDPEFRGHGAGKALLHHLAKLAVSNGCGRFEWNVLDWNQPAIDFYQSFGAEPLSEWVGYRLSGDALRMFAASE